MSFENSSKNKYESMVQASDGSLVLESKLPEYEHNLELKKYKETHDEEGVEEGKNCKDVIDEEVTTEAEKEKTVVINDIANPAEKKTQNDNKEVKKKGVSRRNFLVGIGGAATIGAIGGSGLFDDVNKKDISNKTNDFIESVAKRFERPPVELDPVEQFIKYGKIKNLHTGIEAVKDEHFRHLTKDKNGVDDMRIAAENMSMLDMDRFTKPFVDAGLPPQLCYMIAVQETRGRNITSWAGARSIMGIMPKTAKALGYTEEEIDDPYIASEVSAKYCVEEQKRFNEGDMILHAYNGGGSLFEFTGKTPRIDRTTENFYSYMEEDMNKTYDEIVSRSYVNAKIRKGDTISRISQKWGVSMSEVLALNNLSKQSIIHPGNKIKIAFENSQEMLEKIFSKELEVLRYTPEVKAKYEVLKDQGLLAHLDSGFGEDVTSPA